MIRLIRAELYKAASRAYLYVLLSCILVSMVSGIFMINMIIKPHTIYVMMCMYLQFLMVLTYLIIAFVDMTAGDEIKENTLKNTLSSGISRTSVYLSKIISSTILTFLSAAIMLSVFLGFVFILFEPGKELTAAFLSDFVLRLLSAIPLYIAAITIGVLLCFAIKRNSVVTAVYIALFAFTGGIFNLLGIVVSKIFLNIYRALISTNINALAGQSITHIQMLKSAGIGFAYTILFTLAGIIIFKRQDIQ